MRGLGSVIVMGMVLASACKKNPPEPARDDSPQAKQRRACDRFATETAQTAALAGQMLVTALDEAPMGAEADRSRAGIRNEARKAKTQLFDKCMTWPQDVLDCLPPLGILKSGCEEKLLAAMDGAQAAPTDIPAGPKPAWTVTLDGTVHSLAVTDDGSVLASTPSGDRTVHGIRNGAIAWQKWDHSTPWLVHAPGPTPTWLTGVDNRLVAFDPATGEERWSAVLPALRYDDGDPDDVDETDELDGLATYPSVRLVARDGDAWVVGDAEARFFRVNPADCAKSSATPGGQAKASSCVVPDGNLTDEYLDSDAQLWLDGNGNRYLWEDRMLRAFASDWRLLMTVEAHESLEHVVMFEDRLVLVIDQEVVELDPTQCRGSGTFGVSDWPHPGTMVFEGSDECSHCQRPPPGCRRSHVDVDTMGTQTPGLSSDGAVVVHTDGYTQALAGGASRWKVVTRGMGPLVAAGDHLFGAGDSLRDEDGPVGLFELSPADGTMRWRSPLPATGDTSYYSDDIRLAHAPGWLVASFESTVVGLPLPPG